MLNVSCSDFILYNNSDHNYKVISIKFSYEYCKNMILSLKSVYFDKLLHDICKLSDNTNTLTNTNVMLNK